MLTAERLRLLFDYNSATGVFVSRKKLGRLGAGSVAGSVHPSGYRFIKIDGVSHLAHRLAWLYTRGDWPSGDLDHKNRKKDDNKISNLRLATQAQNNANANLARGILGVRGVSRSGNKFVARTRVDGRDIYLGRFVSLADAAKVARAERIKHFGEFALNS